MAPEATGHIAASKVQLGYHRRDDVSRSIRHSRHLLVLIDDEPEVHLRQPQPGETDVIRPLHAQNAPAAVVHLEHFRLHLAPAALSAQAETARPVITQQKKKKKNGQLPSTKIMHATLWPGMFSCFPRWDSDYEHSTDLIFPNGYVIPGLNGSY